MAENDTAAVPNGSTALVQLDSRQLIRLGENTGGEVIFMQPGLFCMENH